ncbi:MAG: M23 family metallopeptidase [Alphaproteobacteria bacterium]|nr:M23 family metallopeptidase [Alphaproteobacteria bacterium]
MTGRYPSMAAVKREQFSPTRAPQQRRPPPRSRRSRPRGKLRSAFSPIPGSSGPKSGRGESLPIICGNESTILGAAHSAAGFYATASYHWWNNLDYMAMYRLTATARGVVAAGMQIASYMKVSAAVAFCTQFLPYAAMAGIASTLHLGAAAAFCVHFLPLITLAAAAVAVRATCKNTRISRMNRASIGASALMLAANTFPLISQSYFMPALTKAYGAFLTMRNGKTLLSAKWRKQAKWWHKTMAVAGFVASASVFEPEIRGFFPSHETHVVRPYDSDPPVPESMLPQSSSPFVLKHGQECRVSDYYGWRVNPFTHKGEELHPGIDLATAKGTPVHDVVSGTVKFVGEKSGYGQHVVEVESVAPDGEHIRIRYGHMEDAYVRVGQHVENGVVIGRVGSEGRSTGPHLHLEKDVFDRESGKWTSEDPLWEEQIFDALQKQRCTGWQTGRPTVPQPLQLAV